MSQIVDAHVAYCNAISDLSRDKTELLERIKQLEEELERTKQDRNAIAKNTREPLLWQLDHANERIKRLEDAYAAKDKQLSNLLHICRDNDIEVSSYDLIHGRKP